MVLPRPRLEKVVVVAMRCPARRPRHTTHRIQLGYLVPHVILLVLVLMHPRCPAAASCLSLGRRARLYCYNRRPEMIMLLLVVQHTLNRIMTYIVPTPRQMMIRQRVHAYVLLLALLVHRCQLHLAIALTMIRLTPVICRMLRVCPYPLFVLLATLLPRPCRGEMPIHWC